MTTDWEGACRALVQAVAEAPISRKMRHDILTNSLRAGYNFDPFSPFIIAEALEAADRTLGRGDFEPEEYAE